MSHARQSRSAPLFPQIIGPAVIPSSRWIRVKFGGEIVADSKRALLLRQYGPGRLPTYYFPRDDVRMDRLEPAAGDRRLDGPSTWTIKVGDKVAEAAASTHDDPTGDFAPLADYITFAWSKMDGWYEEEEEIFVHARDPFKRVDVLPSSRHIRVVIDGQTVADTHRPFLLFEAPLPTRYYLPQEDVRMDLLAPTATHTRCPYKGLASYWSVKLRDHTAEDVVWGYPDPIPECPKIKDLLCFYNEKVDVYVDEELQARPRTPWSE